MCVDITSLHTYKQNEILKDREINLCETGKNERTLSIFWGQEQSNEN